MKILDWIRPYVLPWAYHAAYVALFEREPNCNACRLHTRCRYWRKDKPCKFTRRGVTLKGHGTLLGGPAVPNGSPADPRLKILTEDQHG